MNTPVNISSFNYVTIERSKLLEAITENKKTHDEIHENALQGYYKRVKEEIQKRIDLLTPLKESFQKTLSEVHPETGIAVALNTEHQYSLFNLGVPFPSNHSDDYNRAIRMVELSAHELFSLSEKEFAQYVMNDWAWRQDFLASNSLYLSGQAPIAALKKF